jgi:phage tail sheath protein FI
MLPTEQDVTLSGGDDGLVGMADEDYVGTERGRNGLRALDPLTDLAILLVPGAATPVVHKAMVDYCAAVRGGQVFPVLDPPAGLGAEAMVEYVEAKAQLLEVSEFGAMYWPRVRIANPSKRVFGLSALVTAPPSGIIAGVLARNDAARAGGIYDPPAGIEVGAMRGVFGFEVPDSLDEKKRDIVFPKRINPLTTDVGLPFFIDGARTLKSTGNFPYVHERRGVSFIERSLKRGLQFARHRANTESLRARVRRTLQAFLNTQMKNGAFASQEPEKAYFVDVSDALNTPSVIAGGELVADIGLATTKPAEFVVLRVSADTRALEATLAAD